MGWVRWSMLNVGTYENVAESVLGNEGVFFLVIDLKLKSLQNAGMKEEILNRKLSEFRSEYIF